MGWSKRAAGLMLALGMGLGSGLSARGALPNPEVEIWVNLTDTTSDDYLGWSPTPCQIRLKERVGADVEITLTNASQPVAGAGRVQFALSPDAWREDNGDLQPELSLILPGDAAWVKFAVAGLPKHASTGDSVEIGRLGRDTPILAHFGGKDGPVIGSAEVMVRVRKNADLLTPGERDRFIWALARLNAETLRGDASEYELLHSYHQAAMRDAHDAPAFLPWHRAFLLHLERLLQGKDPRVSLPYWDFHKPAPRVLSPEFMGVISRDGRSSQLHYVAFTRGHPFSSWRVSGQPIYRGPRIGAEQPDLQELQFVPTNLFGGFCGCQDIEYVTHNYMHKWVGGTMLDIQDAVVDPLFFLIHCNIDRLWAHWQTKYGRFGTDGTAYVPQGIFRPGENGERWARGQYLNDLMWPWNNGCRGDTSGCDMFPPRPGFGPPASPSPADLIDYQGRQGPGRSLGYDYDDVPFGSLRPVGLAAGP